LARITVEDCLKRVPNRFLLVHMAAKTRPTDPGRFRIPGEFFKKMKDIVVSLREIAAGKVFIKQKDKKTDEKQIDDNASDPR